MSPKFCVLLSLNEFEFLDQFSCVWTLHLLAMFLHLPRPILQWQQSLDFQPPALLAPHNY